MSGHELPFDDIERSLAHLAEDVVFPPTPSLTVGSGTADRSTGLRQFPLWRVGLVAAAVLLVAIVAIPNAREAVADWLGVPGIRIEIGDELPPATVTTIGGSLLLGQATALDDIQDQVGFPIQIPAALSAEAPETYLNQSLGTPVVSLLYPVTGDLPEIGSTGVGLLLMEIDAAGDTPYLILKRAGIDAQPEPVRVNGNDGFWIQGGMLVADSGDPFWSFARRSGNVLVWAEDGITYRMESDLPLDEALAIAESLEPARP